MNQATNQTNRVETQLVFTADASKANAELKRLQDSTKQVDRAAEEAKKRLDQLGGAGRAAQGYGVAAPAGGSVAMANAQAMAQGGAFPTYQAGANPFRTSPMMGVGGFGGGGGGGGAGGSEQAKLGELMAMFGKAAAAVAVFASAVDAAGRAVRRDGSPFGVGNTLLNDTERRQRSISGTIMDLPLIGGAMRSAGRGMESLFDGTLPSDFAGLGGKLFFNRTAPVGMNIKDADAMIAMTGQRLQRQPLEYERDRALAAIRTERQGRNIDNSFARDFANSEMERANATGMIGAVFRISDRNMNPAERDAQFALRQASSAVATQQARYASATGERMMIEEQLRIQRNTFNRYPVDRQAISEASVNQGSLRPNLTVQAQSMRGQVNANDVLNTQARLQEALQKEREILNELYVKKLEATKASVNLQKVQLEMAKQELQIRNGQASSFGMKSGSDRQLIADAFGRFKELGFGGLSEDDRSLLGSDPLTSETIRRAAIESARNDPRFSSLVQSQGMASFGELETRVSLQNKIEVKLLTDEAALREEFAKLGDVLLKLLSKALRDGTEDKFKVLGLKVMEQQAIQNIE